MALKLERIAQELWNVEGEIKNWQTKIAPRVKELEERREELRAALLASMQKSRLKTVRVESGDIFVRTVRAKFEITDQAKADSWGRENDCMRLDKTRANSILLRLPKVPDGFEQRDEEHLTIKKNNEK